LSASEGIHATALRMLARRALSRHELEERLAARGFSPAAVRAELVRLRTAGLLDDDKLGESVRSSELARGRGRRAVAARLRRRGLGRESTQSALAAITESELEEALSVAIAHAARRHPAWARLPRERQKVIRYLLARGFGPGEVRRALAKRQEEERESADTVEPADPTAVP
jgi:regulatory protein